MKNVLFFTLPQSNIFHGRIQLDLKTMGMTELKEVSPFVFVLPNEYLFRYIYGFYFLKRNIAAHVNVDQSVSPGEVSVFLHIRTDEPIHFDNIDKQNIKEISDLMSFPENGQLTEAIYGVIFQTEQETLNTLLENFNQVGFFLVTLGMQDVPGFMVITTNESPVVKTNSYTTMTTIDFFNSIMPKT